MSADYFLTTQHIQNHRCDPICSCSHFMHEWNVWWEDIWERTGKYNENHRLRCRGWQASTFGVFFALKWEIDRHRWTLCNQRQNWTGGAQSAPMCAISGFRSAARPQFSYKIHRRTRSVRRRMNCHLSSAEPQRVKFVERPDWLT